MHHLTQMHLHKHQTHIHLHLILISGQEPLYYPISLHTFGVYNGNDHDELS